MNELKEQIRSVLREHGRFASDPGSIADDADLYALGLTSHASVGVMLALESTFDIEFPDRMLTRAVFESVSAIGTAVEELLRAK